MNYLPSKYIRCVSKKNVHGCRTFCNNFLPLSTVHKFWKFFHCSLSSSGFWPSDGICLRRCNLFAHRILMFFKHSAQRESNLYPHIFTNFGRFILVFTKMAFIFLQVLIVFTISSFQFHQVKLLLLHRQRWLVPNSPDLRPLVYHVWGNAGVLLYKLQPKSKQFPSSKMHFSWIAPPHRRKRSTDFCKWLQACVSANGVNVEYIMW